MWWRRLTAWMWITLVLGVTSGVSGNRGSRLVTLVMLVMLVMLVTVLFQLMLLLLLPTSPADELSPSVGDAAGCCTTDWQVDTPVAHKVGWMLRV